MPWSRAPNKIIALVGWVEARNPASAFIRVALSQFVAWAKGSVPKIASAYSSKCWVSFLNPAYGVTLPKIA